MDIKDTLLKYKELANRALTIYIYFDQFIKADGVSIEQIEQLRDDLSNLNLDIDSYMLSNDEVETLRNYIRGSLSDPQPLLDGASLISLIPMYRNNGYFGGRKRQDYIYNTLDKEQARNYIVALCRLFDAFNDKAKNLIDVASRTNGTEKASEGCKIPPELDTPRAREIFKKATEKGLIEETPHGYKWNDTSKARLAYMCERLYCRDEDNNDNGKPFPETALNTLFGVTRLGKTRFQYSGNKNSNGKPKGYKTIDRLFEESSR
jgi:hypothetical protein